MNANRFPKRYLLKKSDNSKTNSKTKTNRGKQNKKVLKTKKSSYSSNIF